MSISILADLCAKQKAAAREADKSFRDRASNAVDVLDIEKDALTDACLVGLLERNRSALESPAERAALEEVGRRKLLELRNAYEHPPSRQNDVPAQLDEAASTADVSTSSSSTGATSVSGDSMSESLRDANDAPSISRSMPRLTSGPGKPASLTEKEEALHQAAQAAPSISNATAVPTSASPIDALSSPDADSHMVSSINVLGAQSATASHWEADGNAANNGATSGSVSPSYSSTAGQKATSFAAPIASSKAATVPVRQASPIVTDRDNARSMSASQSRNPTAPAPS